MKDYQKRVVEEKKELDGRINRLSNFIRSESCKDVNTHERYRLDAQLKIMHDYSNVLNERINVFSVETESNLTAQ